MSGHRPGDHKRGDGDSGGGGDGDGDGDGRRRRSGARSRRGRKSVGSDGSGRGSSSGERAGGPGSTSADDLPEGTERPDDGAQGGTEGETAAAYQLGEGRHDAVALINAPGKGIGGGGKKGKNAGGGKKGKGARGLGSLPEGADGSAGGGMTPGGWQATRAMGADEIEKQLSGEDGWDPSTSTCWAPRAQWSDAKSLIDTEDVELERFKNDWRRVAVDLGVGRAIKAAQGGGARDEPDIGDPRVDAVGEVMWELRHAYVVTFDFYAAVGASTGGAQDLSFISLNVWTQFLNDFNIVDQKSKFLKQSDLDTLFISIDSHAARVMTQHLKDEEDAKQAAKAKPGGGLQRQATTQVARQGAQPVGTLLQRQGTVALAKFEDKKQKFSRVEFMAAIVKIAIKKFVDTKQLDDVAVAVRRFLTRDIVPRLRPAHRPATAFRLTHLYARSVENVLKAKLPSLQAVFDGLVSRAKNRQSRVISLTEWLAFLRAAGVTGLDATERDASLCFAWSRMGVVSELTETGQTKQENLPFEGFLEALVRVAGLKALPNDAELEAARAPHAAAFLEAMKLNQEDKYIEFMQKRACTWGAERRTREQPLHRAVDHLLSIVLHAILKDDVAGAEEIKFEAMLRWMDRTMASDQPQGQRQGGR